ncbi:uncharacterized protein LOC119725395 [Patiria miniata]|uniref:protein-tyrosine-phosphatase n=1 Tax=Patiria miniata TaxID=46514 RepID=A0A913ZLT0_PATMI|nr:uncharacterized protein LOC119725395 [Patiria miniata]
MMFRDDFGTFLVAFVVFSLKEGVSLDLRGPKATVSQSSTSLPAYRPSKAVDRDIGTSSHTGYASLEEQTNPWWKVDLGAVYCLRKITLVNRIDDVFSQNPRRLHGSVIRAGLSSNHLQNPEVGRVAYDDAISGAVIDFLPDPYVTARYVSVDIPRSGRVDGINTILNLVEVMIEEVTTDTIKTDTTTGGIRRIRCAVKTIYLGTLNLTGLPSSQSSDYSNSSGTWYASGAVDGSLLYGYDVAHCSHTDLDQNPWWKIDMTSVHCIGKIAIRNPDHLEHDVRLRLQGAVVRAGLSDAHLDNPTCGSPVSLYQALINDWIEFTCDPSRPARYVSVDIPRETWLSLAEVMVWPCELHPAALNLTDKPSTQSSTDGFIPGKAVDSLPGEPYCSRTMEEMNPWWKLDLKASQCLGKIRVRPSVNGPHLQDGVVRAGLSDRHTNNVMCGTPVSQVQAETDEFAEFTCDPPVLARYVSVDIPGMARLGLCEVTVITCDFQQTDSGIDFTLVTNPALIGDNDASITAYKGPDDITASVSFGRQLTIRGNSGALPSGSMVSSDPSTGCAARLILRLPEEGGIDRTGVFYSEAISNDITTRIQTVILSKNESTVHIRPVVRTQTASIGDSVVLQMRDVNSPNTNYRWRRDGGDVIDTWRDLLSVLISTVAKDDDGVYSCFVSDQEEEQLHGIMRLIVRDCPSGRWDPPSCLKTCRRCYNGGVCHDESGTCVCAPGFSGDNCEQAHGRKVFGKTADQRCLGSTDPHREACRGRLFCLPDPYGCSCAAGYMGLDCMQECPEGAFGADCKQTCHCASGGTCSKDTGECSNGCEAPYFGSNCQCTTQNGVLGLEVSSGDPHQLFVAWQPDPCSSGYELTTTDECEDTIAQESIQETFHFITGLESTLNYRVYIRPLYPGDVKGPEVTKPPITKPTESPTEVNSTSVTSTSLSFSWSKPPCGSRGGIITGYTYILTEVGPPSTEVVQSVTSEESVTIQGLSPLTEYSFQVAASTTAGAGLYSQAQVKTTLKVTAPQMDTNPATNSSSAVIGGSVAAAVILILVVIIVVIVLYKRRRRRKNQPSDGVHGETSLPQNKAFEADVDYQVPEPTAEPAPYTSLGDGVVTISSAQPIAQNPSISQDVDDYEVCSAEPHAYTYIDADIMKKSSVPQTERKPKPKPPLKPHAADATYEVPDSAVYASVDEGKEKSSAPSIARKPKPKPHPKPSIPQPAADEDAQEQLIRKLFSQLTSVRVEELPEYIRKKEQAGQNGFPADFMTLPDGQLRPATVAMKPQNESKNLDTDIIVYDHSRVVLEPLQNDPDSDYINACYIDGYLEKDMYIASQGPTESTVGDFWRMVWQTKVDKIIMLTNPVENGEVNCHQYWPDTGIKTYSDIAVSTEKEDVFLDYTIRAFRIDKVFSAESNRLVKQFHFKTWPDMEAPEHPTTVLNFMQVVNAEHNKGRTVVHCSNGIGRTGTYIALDSMLDQMRQEGQVDVLGFIYRMRQKRNKMVQTPAQYRFIFEALLAASKEDDTSYENVGKGAKKAKKQVAAKLTGK